MAAEPHEASAQVRGRRPLTPPLTAAVTESVSEDGTHKYGDTRSSQGAHTTGQGSAGRPLLRTFGPALPSRTLTRSSAPTVQSHGSGGQ